MAIPQVVASTPDHAVGSIERIVLCVWRGETTLLGLTSLNSVIRSLSEQTTGPIALLTVIESGIPIPSSSIRSRITEMLGKVPSTCVASAVVIEADGFLAAAARSVVIGLVSLNRLPYPHRAFGSLPEAAKFLSQHFAKSAPSISLSPNEIAESVIAFRASLEKRA